jgi:hypothetical protein
MWYIISIRLHGLLEELGVTRYLFIPTTLLDHPLLFLNAASTMVLKQKRILNSFPNQLTTPKKRKKSADIISGAKHHPHHRHQPPEKPSHLAGIFREHTSSQQSAAQTPPGIP